MADPNSDSSPKPVPSTDKPMSDEPTSNEPASDELTSAGGAAKTTDDPSNVATPLGLKVADDASDSDRKSDLKAAAAKAEKNKGEKHKSSDDDDDEPPTRRGLPGWMLPVMFVSLLVLLFLWPNSASDYGVTVPYSFVLEQLENKNIEYADLVENDRYIVGEWTNVPDPIEPRSESDKPLTLEKKFNAVITRLEDRTLLDKLAAADVRTGVAPPANGTAGIILLNFLPLLLLVGFFWFMMRRSSDPMGSGGMFGSFVKSPAKRFKADDKLATFDDVAGMEGPKHELEEIVEFLRNPQKFQRLGAEIPKGVLLSGPPGTGKTLLGRATAGEAGVAFFSINGSEFIQMFVGVGASRVRDMFKTAREAAPCILFIDEIDAIGRVRGAGVGGGHDEREQTLNQILSEMDGFSQTEAVIVVGATNRPDVLDPALLRPGRFDRKVEVDRPGKKGREGILKVHSRNVPLADDVNMEEIAASTIGFSGAELRNLVNEAALRAVRLNKNKVDQSDLLDAFEKVTLGVPRDEKFNEEDTKSTAYHEAGHALVTWYAPHVDPLFKVSIIPRGRTGGVMWSRPDEELMSESEARLRGRMAVAMGGRAAEKLVFNELNSGASSDLQMATRTARLMVGRLGMSSKIGPVAFDQSGDDPFLGREMAEHSRKYSESTAHLMDQEVQRLLFEAEERAIAILTEHRDKLDLLAQLLLENEVVDREQLTEVIGEPAARSRGWKLEHLASVAATNTAESDSPASEDNAASEDNTDETDS